MLLILIIGVGIGCIYGLIAAGYSLIYSTTGIVNFAQGVFVMVGGMATHWFLTSERVAYPLAILGGIVFAVVDGLALWFVVIIPLWRRRAASYYIILATLIFALVTQSVILRWQGSNPVTLPEWTPGLVIAIAGGHLPSNYLWIIASMVAIVIGLGAFLKGTILGKEMRACSADRDVSMLLGIAPGRVGGLAMVVAAGIGGLGGVLITPVQFTSFNVGVDYTVFGFVAAIVGGLGSLPGAVGGGIVVGVIGELSSRYFSSAYGDVITFGVLLAFLVVRPQGILGKVEAASG